MAFSLGEYQDVFLEEVDELLQELNQNLLRFERDPEDSSIIDDIFRAAHTLKSSAAFVGLNELSELAHQMEDLLQGLRDGSMKMSDDIVNIIFKCFDEINAAIGDISSGQEPEQDFMALIEQIHVISKVSKGKVSGSNESASNSADNNYIIPKTKLKSADVKIIKQNIEDGLTCFELTVFIDPAAQMKRLKEQLIVSSLERSNAIIQFPDENDNIDNGNVFKVILATSNTEEDLMHSCNVDQVIKATLRTITLEIQEGKTAVVFNAAGTFTIGMESQVSQGSTVASAAPKLVKNLSEEGAEVTQRKTPTLKTVKVSIEKLDQLLNNVGELVIINSGFYRLYDEFLKVLQDKTIIADFKNRMDQMSRVAKDLQSGIMKTRMLPIGQVFNRFDRLVRDLTKEKNKKIDLIIQGEDTELDKKVIDSIGDPLIHLIRNSVDHGVEMPEERLALGKPETGVIILNAYQSGSQIIVEVTDDGKGLDIDRIKAKAIDKGLADMDSIAAMTNDEIFKFIFMPGFSTADHVTDISGRGVGMNVVKETVMDLNGNVTIRTEKNIGSTFFLEFPLTLAIISAVLIKIGDELYAIPLSDIDETISIDYTDITTIEGHEVIDLRGEVLSILRLSRFVGTRSKLTKGDKIPIVIVGYANRKIGIVVDSLEGKMEIVIKSIEQNYRAVRGLAGASILGDGSICLILDVATMVNMAISDNDFQYLSRGMFDGETGEVQIVEDHEEIKTQAEEVVEQDVETELTDDLESDTESEQEEDEVQEETEISSSDDNINIEDDSMSLDDLNKMFLDEDAKYNIQQNEVESVSAETEQFDGEEVPIELESNDTVEVQVIEALNEFKKELSQNILETLDSNIPDILNTSDDFSRESIKQLQHVANIGAAHAADSLSTILSKQVDISIPEVTVVPIDKVPERTGCIDDITYIGVILSVKEDTFGSILFVVNEKEAFELIDILYDSSTKEAGVLDDYCESILKEITNIVGSALLNVIAEKIDMTIQPNVPILVHETINTIMRAADIEKNSIEGHVIVMDTAFFLEGDKLIGHLVLLPNSNVGKTILKKLEK